MAKIYLRLVLDGVRTWNPCPNAGDQRSPTCLLLPNRTCQSCPHSDIASRVGAAFCVSPPGWGALPEVSPAGS